MKLEMKCISRSKSRLGWTGQVKSRPRYARELIHNLNKA